MSRFTSVPEFEPGMPPVEIASPEGDISMIIEAGQLPDGRKIVVAEHLFPGTPENNARTNADQILRSNYDRDSDEFEYISSIGPMGLAGIFNRFSTYTPLSRSLGYNFEEVTHVGESQTTSRWVFEYPSLDQLNGSLEAIDQGDPGFRFTRFAGGKYSTTQFMPSFVEDGEFLVATEQPYELHDHAALHLLGELGLAGTLGQYIRSTLGSYLTRMQAEKLLPPVEMDSSTIEKFFNPSRAVIDNAMLNIDLLSNRIAVEVFKSDHTMPRFKNQVLIRGLRYGISGFFSFGSLGERTPQDVIEEPPEEELDGFIDDILNRYARLHKYILEQAQT